MPRARKEWIGKTPDTKAPPRVRQRVYDDAGGICHICSLSIKTGETWHADHVIALIEGGENRESNLKPAHGHCNLAKAAQEASRKSKVANTRQKHIGIRDAPKMQTRPMQTTPKAAERKQKASEKIQPPGLSGIYRRIAR